MKKLKHLSNKKGENTYTHSKSTEPCRDA